jgi:hypothetical protein
LEGSLLIYIFLYSIIHSGDSFKWTRELLDVIEKEALKSKQTVLNCGGYGQWHITYWDL